MKELKRALEERLLRLAKKNTFWLFSTKRLDEFGACYNMYVDLDKRMRHKKKKGEAEEDAQGMGFHA